MTTQTNFGRLTAEKTVRTMIYTRTILEFLTFTETVIDTVFFFFFFNVVLNTRNYNNK